MRLRKLCAVLLIALVPAMGANSAALAEDNTAVVVNTKDDSSVFKLAFNIHRAMTSSVDVDNAAVAVSSCNSCRTIAVAISAVLIFSDPDVVTTDNLALALNLECTLCETMALAYQIVLTTGGPVHFTADGNKAINDLLQQIKAVGESDLSLAEIDAQISALVDQLWDVIRTETVAAGRPVEEEATQATTDTAQPTAETTPSPTESPTPEPTSEPTPTESPSAEPTSSPTP